MFLKAKLIEWLKRYGPAEIGGTITVYLGFAVCNYFSDAQLASAAVGALTENIGFYSVVFFFRLRDEGKLKTKRRLFTEMITEFGPSEILDSFILRPFCLVVGVELCGPGFGLLLGKIVSDVLFYIPVIATYELRKWWLNSRRAKISTDLP